MTSATLRLHGDLTFFTRAASLEADFNGNPSLKDLVESIGVPHPEVDVALLDGVSVDLSALVHEGATIDVFPAKLGPDGKRLLPPSQDVSRFVLDGHLGRLARVLRMLGFDTLWESDPEDEDLAATSAREDRVLLTRDLGLLKRNLVRRGAFVRSTAHLAQAREIIERFELKNQAHPFARCIACNGVLREVSEAEAANRAPPRVRERHHHFVGCDGCGRTYWAGTHHDRMKSVVDEVLSPAAT